MLPSEVGQEGSDFLWVEDSIMFSSHLSLTCYMVSPGNADRFLVSVLCPSTVLAIRSDFLWVAANLSELYFFGCLP